jgi:phosphoserine phosphatase RsbU/P
MKILVADDDPVVRTIVTSGLKALGHSVVGVDDGAKAWATYKQAEFPVVVTDWQMPEVDGLQLTQLVRRARRDNYTYVVMLTGKGKREDYLMAVKAGVDAFLVKPLDGAMLEAQITIATRILNLQAHTRQLEAMMTVCAHCKRVKEKSNWVSMEQYIVHTYKTRPSHGYCPQCFEEKVAPEMRELGISTEGLSGL